MVIKKKYLFIFIIVSSAIWSSSLVLFDIPNIGIIYPLRIILFIYSIYLLFSFLTKVNYTKRYSRTNMMLSLFLIYVFFITVVNKRWDDTSIYLVSFVTIALLLSLLIRIIKSENDRRVAIWAILLNVVILYCLSLYESNLNVWLFSSLKPTKYNLNFYGKVTPMLFFGNTNNLCMFISLSLPCAFIVSKNILIRIFFFFIAFHISIMCDCRTGLVLLVIFLVIIVSIKWINSKKMKYIIGFFGACIGVFLLFFKNDLLDVRFFLWINAFYNSACNFFIGTGAGSAKYINAQNGIFDIVKGGALGGYQIGAVHNYFLELLIESGIIGVSILYTWLAPHFICLVRYRKSEIGLYYFSLLIFFLVAALCQSTLTQWFQIWLYLGLMISYSYDINKKESCRGVNHDEHY